MAGKAIAHLKTRRGGFLVAKAYTGDGIYTSRSSASAGRHRSLSELRRSFWGVEIIDVVAYGQFAGDVKSWVSIGKGEERAM
jgi:hypothetical protein